MSKINDGGPAFPTANGTMTDGTVTVTADCETGMTLRDWFAAQMLPRIGIGWPNEENRALLAKQAYQMADAMLAERERQP